jgi:sugar lactone lactonase YvrE
MKKFLTVVLLIVGMQGLSGLAGWQAVQAQPGWYVGNKAPLQPLHFITLPVGSIRPEGWVLKYLELQRDGLTGQLGQISAWLDKTNNAWYSGNGAGDHGWEEVPYWLKGYGDLGYILKDTTIIAETKRWLDKVFQSQRADGYFGPQMKEMDLWPNMLMLWCMQSYYDYSKDARVIPFMTRYFKWEMTVPDGQFLKTYWENSRGGDNLYSVYWLYNHTGEAWLLDLAKKIHQHTANWEQAGPGSGSGTLPNWHNVNIAQCFREPATYYMQTADKRDLDATYNDFRLVRAIYGQVPGGMFGADENARPGYTDPRQAIETCGMVEQMASDEMLAGITGDVAWADNCEDVAFNTYPAAVMPDFKSLRYLTAPNMVVSDSMDHSPGIQNKGPFLMMNPFSSRCCQHNHSQGWPYYSEHLWMATPDSGVVAMLYGASTVKVRVGDGREVELVEKTNYPFEERVRITVKGAGSFPLWLRIPGWCDSAKVMVNGVAGHIAAQAGGYARIAREWKPGDMVELKLPMKVSVRKWETNKNSVSVNYGPLSFSLRITENYQRMNSEKSAIGDSKWQATADPAMWPAYEITPGSKWNYGLALTDKPLAQQFEVVRRPYPGGGFPWSAEAAPLLLKVKGELIPGWGIDQYGLCGVLPQSPVDVEDGAAAGQGGGSGVQTIELIPMGAARLRISSFPVVATGPRKERAVWSKDKAAGWYAEKGWLRGSNFIPSTAINQLEMWQAATFDPETIDRELGYAEGIGFNTMRVFLHHLAWQQDPAGFKNRMNTFLALAAKHHIQPMFVFFDDCWNDTYHAGKQPVPKVGVHNSGWLRDPGSLYYTEPLLRDTLERYVKDVLGYFKHDHRILMWDLYNEPGNSDYGSKSLDLLGKVFRWAREVNPEQPLSSGVWDRKLTDLNTLQLANDDVITYHNYENDAAHAQAIDTLKKYGRPLICTEYMARTRGSRFDNIMPLLKRDTVGALNWGFVSGKTNTIYAWDHPMPDGAEPPVWFHDIFRRDGTPFSTAEVRLIRSLTGAAAGWIEVLKPEGENIFDTTGGVRMIASGFKWTEGPLYVPAGAGGGAAGDYLLFSDVPHNKIYQWKRNGDTSVFLMPSGFTGTGVKEREPGSNGLLYDKFSGSLLLMQQGDRRVAKMDAPLNAAAAKFVVLADRYKGKRLNSPNDGVLAADGGIYFTDPPYGLDGLLADTAKDLTFQGVFYVRTDRRLTLVTDELKYPNGIALSPDGKTLYVNNSDSLDRRWMKYGLGADGLISDKHVFFQYGGVEHGNPDGMKVNKAGYVFSAGPGGLWVFNPAGVPVARVHVGQLVSNCAFGKDGKELFITATDQVLRVGLK